MMLSPKAVKAAGDKFGLHPVCAGPYRFVERVQQDRIVVEKFADYWNRDNVHIDRIVYLPIVDATVRLANLKSGGLDISERMLATDIKDIRADPKLRLATALELGYQGITINMGDNERAKATPLGRSAKVRQALSLAIDRDALNQVVFNGEFVPGNQWVNPEHPYFQKSFPVPKRDLARAKALMAEAGATAPFTVDFMVPKGAETGAVAEMVQAMAADIGITMKIRVTEFATSLKQAEAYEYQAYPAGLERPHRPGRQRLHLPDLPRPAGEQRHLQCGRRQVSQRGPHGLGFRRPQGDLREADQGHPRGGPDRLSLSPPRADRPQRPRRRLQADARRPGARGGAEGEVRVNLNRCQRSPPPASEASGGEGSGVGGARGAAISQRFRSPMSPGRVRFAAR